MKRLKNTGLIVVAVLFLALQGCSILNQAKAYKRFVQSRFRIEAATFQKVGGVAVANGRKISLQEGLQITQKLFQKQLFVQVLLQVQVQNPYTQQAEVSGLDWVIEKEGAELARGQVSQPVVVPANQSASFPVEAVFNASKVLQSQNLQQILGFVSGSDNEKKFNSLGLTFKVKPWYKMAGQIHKFPGYITIKPAS